MSLLCQYQFYLYQRHYLKSQVYEVAISPLIAIDPSFVADKGDKAPRKPPIGVRATPTTHTSVHKDKTYLEYGGEKQKKINL